jgi:pimeloyl-ACP methyl ester carboxylesterase
MTKYRRKTIEGLELFYREAGRDGAPTIVLLHGFPSSSHMFRDLIPLLAQDFHLIAPDYPGFGYSAVPAPSGFSYTFDNLTSYIERLLFDIIGLKRFSLYLQDYGGPIGFRIASRHPQAIDALIIQNANAYLKGVSSALTPLQAYWQNRQANEAAVRGFLTADTTKFQYLHGAADPASINPDAYMVDQLFLDRPSNDAV